jgi:predicted MFS family arabinose efflux permease
MAVLGPRTAVLGAITLFGTAMLLMPLTTSSLVLSLLALGLWAAGTWFGVPAMQAIVASHSDRLRGTMLAFNSSALNLAGVVGPIVIGAVISGAGFGAAFLTGSLLAVATFALAWVVLPRRVATGPVPAAGA